ncbi:hypothetical protein F4553_004110 [Allocatelliglobosispora scoriae]|uniref:Uncharacterized protein n=1 Tax=Allocatelliglobosispora scoriae TaxID=643052 RepID=A0A841BVF5_9ACTN|nr:hypothetical protein [Allocatelliglobosispora scoriae]MBB5870731.1 hypothetical protein [Allocatelliglobosispora scoriae]
MGTQGFGLPDLPPEWGEVVIPDDPAELDAEAEIIRRELRRENRRARRAARLLTWRRRLRMPDKLDDPEEPSLALPLIVLGIAVLITVLGLIIVTWPGLSQPAPAPSTPVDESFTSASVSPTVSPSSTISR